MNNRQIAKALKELQDQIWKDGDGQNISGEGMARRFAAPERAYFPDLESAINFFSETKIGACYKTGVSAYERVK